MPGLSMGIYRLPTGFHHPFYEIIRWFLAISLKFVFMIRFLHFHQDILIPAKFRFGIMLVKSISKNFVTIDPSYRIKYSMW